MDDGNETLDWENDTESQSGTNRMSVSNDAYPSQNGRRDFDDVEEDAISLGEDEDDQYFYQREEVDMTVTRAVSSIPAVDRPPSNREREDSVGANDSYSRQSYRERDRYEDSRSRPARSPRGSPQRYPNHHSRNHASPPQTRVTHALPPKPVTSAPYIPPSAIVEATSMTTTPPRAASRDAKRTNGNPHGRSLSPRSHAEGPPYRESRRARSGSRERYHNTQGQESTWNNPVSSIPSSSRGLSSSRRSDSRTTGRTPVSSADSDSYHSQTSRNPHRDREPLRSAKHPQSEYAPLPSDLPEQERHYRPSDAPHVAPRQSEPDEMSRGRFTARSGYDRPPSLSPPRVLRGGRSGSPRPSNDIRPSPHYREGVRPPHRGNQRGRDRDTFTNLDGPPRGDIRPLPRRNAWSSNESPRIPESDVGGRGGRETRTIAARPRSPIFEKANMDSDLRHRSPRRSDIARGPTRDREAIRRADSRERERTVPHQGYSSAPRTLPREDDRSRDYAPYRDNMQTLAPPAPPPQRERPDMPRFERSTSSSGPSYQPAPVDRQPFNTRITEYEARQSAYDNRRPDGQYDRGHRGDLPQDLPREQPRQQSNYGADTSRIPDTRHDLRAQYDRPILPEELPPPTHRRRNPLPPQANIFTTAGNGMRRDPPPHVPVQSFQPPSNDPQSRPRYSDISPQTNAYVEPPPKHVHGRSNLDSHRTPPLPPAFVRRNEGMMAEQRRMGTEDREPHSERSVAEYPRMERFVAMPPPERDDRRPHHQDSGPRNNYSQPPPPRTGARIQQGGLFFDDARNRHPPSPGADTHLQHAGPPQDSIRNRRPPSPRVYRPIFNGHGPEVPTGPRLGRFELPPLKPTAVDPPPKPTPAKTSPSIPTAPNLARSSARQPADNATVESSPATRPGASEPREGNGYPQRGSRRESRRPPEDAGRTAGHPPSRPAVSGPNSVPINNARRMPSAGSSAPGNALPSAASLPPTTASVPAPAVHPLPPVPPPMFNPGAMPPASALINPAKAREMEKKETSASNNTAYDKSNETSPVSMSTQGLAGLVIMTRPETATTEIKRKGTRFSAPKDTPNKERTSPQEGLSQSQPALAFARRDSVISRASQETSMPAHSSLPSKTAESTENKLEGGAIGRQSRFADRQPNLEQSSTLASTKLKEDREPPPQASSWSARMMETEDKSAPPHRHESAPQRGSDDLSSRLSEEKAKPPRHRRLERKHGGDGSIGFSSGPPPDEPLSFQNRADKPPSLLQRLSFDDNSKRIPPSVEAPSPSLRDRIVPAKRDHNDVDGGDRDVSYDADEGNENKRARRKTVKNKRGGRR